MRRLENGFSSALSKAKELDISPIYMPKRSVGIKLCLITSPSTKLQWMVTKLFELIAFSGCKVNQALQSIWSNETSTKTVSLSCRAYSITKQLYEQGCLSEILQISWFTSTNLYIPRRWRQWRSQWNFAFFNNNDLLNSDASGAMNKLNGNAESFLNLCIALSVL